MPAASPANHAWDMLQQSITDCAACPRLREYCQQIAREKRRAFRDDTYWARPVPNFGSSEARLLIVGLAPAAHGANRTGRMFTGDRSGEWLYRALYRAGFANLSASTSRDDGLVLQQAAVTAVCHCAPPENLPTRDEQQNCRHWLDTTIQSLPVEGFIALGAIAWTNLLDLLRDRGEFTGPKPKFAHGAICELADGRWLIGSYHPSQQNTFTGRLTESMFDQIFSAARERLDRRRAASD